MKFSFKGIIFDFDGTLVDSKEGMYRSIVAVFEKMSLPLPNYDDAIKTIGYPPEEKFKLLTGSNNKIAQLTFKKFYLELINPPSSFLLPFAKPFPGVITLLSRIKNEGKKIAIVSNKTRLALTQELIHLELMRFIDVIQAGDDVNYPKPNPEGICNVLLAWNFCAEDVLFVGDHSVDALAANSAKVRFIGVTTGTTSKIELMKYPHLAIADHLKDIL